MREFTLEVNEKLIIKGDIVLTILAKKHPKAIPAQMARIGIDAPKYVKISPLTCVN